MLRQVLAAVAKLLPEVRVAAQAGSNVPAQLQTRLVSRVAAGQHRLPPSPSKSIALGQVQDPPWHGTQQGQLQRPGALGSRPRPPRPPRPRVLACRPT